ncbi:MAG: tyrosine-type recombinase/integrase [Desulfuromonas sp.]|jgi:integrase|nr:tyrosine-type recombinase/integrase [Desulfuromonas sp.]
MKRAFNHPAKGSSIRVDPIRDAKDIRLIKKILSDQPRNLALFVVGINTNLRASDLLRIKVGDVRYLKIGEYFTLREKKTGKLRSITVNKAVFEVTADLIASIPFAQDDDFLFQSRKKNSASGGMLTVSYLNSLVKEWCREINLRGNYGAHTLRKTFGYIHRTVFGTDIPTLMEMFNHSSQRQTLTYLGIQPREINDAYLKEI